MSGATLDSRNAAFWDELCGTHLARSIGITEITPATIAAFDAAYFDYYPYLAQYVVREPLADRRVLEIGLGYGTLGQLIASRGADYHALDIAEGPVRMMRDRLAALGVEDPDARVTQGSALELPFPDASFDYVYSIGCLHHTGDLARGVDEVRRVLRPGGKAVVMLYNARSIRHLVPIRRRAGEELRRAYDSNVAGDAAPHTDYVSPAEVRRLFASFSRVRIDVRNLPDLGLGRARVPRRLLLGNLARIVGTDLYITAEK
jgi:ubiquinone/menaquinone biosynthesis C-methylase UbiE